MPTAIAYQKRNCEVTINGALQKHISFQPFRLHHEEPQEGIAKKFIQIVEMIFSVGGLPRGRWEPLRESTPSWDRSHSKTRLSRGSLLRNSKKLQAFLRNSFREFLEKGMDSVPLSDSY